MVGTPTRHRQGHRGGGVHRPRRATLTYGAPSEVSRRGQVTVNSSTGAYTYTPTTAQRQAATATTTDTFSVTAGNGVHTATETVTVPVDAGTPVAGTPTVGTSDPTTGTVTGAVAFTDPAGRTLTYSAASSTSSRGGSVTVNPSTGAYTYTPTAAQIDAATAGTTDAFTVTANNGVHSTSETVTVPVSPDIPVAGTPTVGTSDPTTGTVTGAWRSPTRPGAP